MNTGLLPHDDEEPRCRAGGGLADHGRYQLRVAGCLDGSWSEWFGGLTVEADYERGETRLTGQVADQAALHGLLNKVRNLGLVLLEVTRLNGNEEG